MKPANLPHVADRRAYFPDSRIGASLKRAVRRS